MSRKLFASLPDRTAAQLLQPALCRIVASQSQQIFQVDGVDPGLASGKPPHRFKPGPQGLLGAMQDRACGNRLVVFASATDAEPSGAHPITGVFASRAVKPLRPPYPKKIVVTGLLLRKAFVKLLLVIMLHSIILKYFKKGKNYISKYHFIGIPNHALNSLK